MLFKKLLNAKQSNFGFANLSATFARLSDGDNKEATR